MVNKTNFETINIDDFIHDPINQEKVQSYPPELVGRFNSFIVTAFDDSMTVEMQIRTMIKWVKENIDVTMSALDNMEAFKKDSMAFQNHVKDTLVNLINQFTDQFDDNLKFETLEILNQWFLDGILSDLVRDAINEEVIDARGGKTTLGQRLNETDQQLVNINNEVINARDGKATLDQRLDETDQQLVNINNEVINARGNKTTLGQRLDETDQQLSDKISKGNVSVYDINKNFGKFDQSFMTEEFIAQFVENTQPINQVIGDNSITTAKLSDKAVTENKTAYFKTVNLFDKYNLIYNVAPNIDNGSLNDAIDRIFCETYIPIKANKTYIATAGLFRLSFYNLEKVYQNATSPEIIKSYFEYKPTVDGFVRLTIHKEFIKGFTFMESSVFSPVGQRSETDVFVNSFDESAIKNKAIEPRHTTFMKTGKNMFDRSRTLDGYFLRIYSSLNDLDSGEPIENPDYFVSHFMKLEKGKPYTLQNVRVWILYGFDKQIIKGENTGTNNSTVTITPSYDCYLRIATSLSLKDSVQVEQNSKVTGYEPYRLTIDGVEMNNVESDLKNKTIMTIGDSIAAGQSQTLNSYAKIIAEKEGMSFQSLAQHGASIGEQETRGKITQQADAIVSSNVFYDYILFNGGTNDSGSPLGTISDGYDATLDKATFSGGFEYIIKTLRTKYPKTKIIYIRVHNMSSRSVSSQIQYGERAIEICKKWSIPYVDLFNEGSLNTQIDIMRNQYTLNGDATHPTYEAYELFYVPPILSKMKSV